MAFFETVFLGGGISCLAAARGFSGDGILFEREARIGGLCRSDEVNGFVFDRTGHLLHLRDARIRELVARLLGNNLRSCTRNSWIFSQGVYTRYPFQSHFYGLPPEVAADCLIGAAQASFRISRRGKKTSRFSDWVIERFGEGIARHFMFPYNRKLWTIPPSELTTEWLGRFVPIPDLREIILGALTDRIGDEGYNATFVYPARRGIESLVRRLAEGLKLKVVTGVAVQKIELRPRRLTLSTGDTVGFGRLITCAPLPELVRMTEPVPPGVRAAAKKLRWASVYNLNLGIPDRREGRHWVYLPENRYRIYRFGYANNFSRWVAPPGMANIYTEIAYDPKRGSDRAAFRRRVITDLIAIGVLKSPRDIVATHENELPFAYAIYDRYRSSAVATLRRFFESRAIDLIGRYGRWEYSSMEDALLQGLSISERLR